MPVYFVVAEIGIEGSEVEETMLWISAVSFWNSERFATSSLENGVAFNWPSTIGLMKRGHRRRHTARKERISRPECLESESQTAEQ